MPFDWRAYFKLAKFLIKLASTAFARIILSDFAREALWRSGVSRAYYAAYCHVRNYARDRLGFQPRRSADDHAKLREHLRRNQGYIEIADLLNQLRSWRNNCDYDDITHRLENMTKNAIQYAREIFDRIELMSIP
jgi:hypothetical protein